MATNHVHRYERTMLGTKGYMVFRCNLPECTHYISAKLAEGKLTLCNRCNNPMILDKRAMRLVKPHCADCIKTKPREMHDKLLGFLEASDSSHART